MMITGRMGQSTSKDGSKSVVLRDVDAESIATTSGMSKDEVVNSVVIILLL